MAERSRHVHRLYADLPRLRHLFIQTASADLHLLLPTPDALPLRSLSIPTLTPVDLARLPRTLVTLRVSGFTCVRADRDRTLQPPAGLRTLQLRWSPLIGVDDAAVVGKLLHALPKLQELHLVGGHALAVSYLFTPTTTPELQHLQIDLDYASTAQAIDLRCLPPSLVRLNVRSDRRELAFRDLVRAVRQGAMPQLRYLRAPGRLVDAPAIHSRLEQLRELCLGRQTEFERWP